MQRSDFPVSTSLIVFAIALLLSACTRPAPETGAGRAERAEAGAAQPAPGEKTEPARRREPLRRQATPPQATREPAAQAGAEAEPDYATPAAPARPGARPVIAVAELADIRAPERRIDRENYVHFEDNAVRRTTEHPVSTFSIDVDTGSYSNVRRMLRAGRLPPGDAVRVEEMINYFGYDYPGPESPDTPFAVSIEHSVTPWNSNTRLLQIGIQGWQPTPEQVPPANLVFLIDVSGSMASPDKLPLLIRSLKMLTGQLDAHDRVAMVAYAGASGVVLESTPGDRHATISAALGRLSAGGRTHGAAGIELAYAQARQGFIEGGINRVILATDGDFNVGTVDFEALVDIAERRRAGGIALTTLGFGTGNYNDHLMERLADAGDGNHAYIDTLGEARKVLVEALTSTLMTIARDVKIQIEFNPDIVAEYRLIGYENRMLEREDFNNDAVDAGDIGAGHTVTALYEIALAGAGGERVDPLRYGPGETAPSRATTIDGRSRELGFLRLRYKTPDARTSRLIERPIERRADQPPSDRLAFAAAVAAFGQRLRGGKYLEGFGLDRVHALASRSKGDDPFGYRGEFLQLVRLAEALE